MTKGCIIVAEKQNIYKYKTEQRQIQRGRWGLKPRSDFKLPNFLKIEMIGFCLTTSSHKSNFHANHAHHTHNAQNWSVEPRSDLRLDPSMQSILPLAKDAKASKTGKANISRDNIMHGTSYRSSVSRSFWLLPNAQCTN